MHPSKMRERAGLRLLVTRQLIEPIVSFKELVERKEIIVVDGRPRPKLQSLRRYVIQDRHHTAGQKKPHDSLVGILLDEFTAGRAIEAVTVVGRGRADPKKDVVGRQTDFAALWTRSLDGGHLCLSGVRPLTE